MSGGKQTRGYTILEVMIVLAVSGFMFLIAASFISGRQATNAFQAGVTNFSTDMQGLLDSVAAGHYTDVPLTCTVVPSGLSYTLSISAPMPGQTQGSNIQCVFLGRIAHLQVSNNPSNYEIFSIAGRRDANGSPITTLSQALPTPVTGAVDLTTSDVIPSSLSVQRVTVTNAAGVSTTLAYAFGFVQSLGSSAPGSTTYSSGGQTLELVYAPNVSSNQSEAAAAASIRAGGLQSARSVVVCLTDGKRYATVSIGSSAYSQVNVTKQLGLSGC